MKCTPKVRHFKEVHFLWQKKNKYLRNRRVFSNGIAKSENGNVVVMVESAERAEDIDEAHALMSAQEVREDLQRSSS